MIGDMLHNIPHTGPDATDFKATDKFEIHNSKNVEFQ